MKRIFFLMGLLVCVLWGCQHDDLAEAINPDPDSKDYNIQFDMPEQMQVVATRGASDDAREAGVNKLDLLFFTSTGSDEGTFHSVASTTEIVSIGGKGMAKITLPYTPDADEAANTLVVLAIANSAYTKVELETLLANTSVAQAKGLLAVESKLSMPATGIGMGGMSTPATIRITTATDILNFTLRRAVARFDVDATATAVVKNFKLMTAEVRNANDRGYLFPDPTGSGALTNIPADAERVHYIRTSNDDRDENATSPGTWLNKITQKLYAYESTTPTAVTAQTTCLIIGGYYTGTDGVPQMGYYRLNIGTKEGVNWNYTVRRNFIYNAVISSVTGPGYPTKDDAYEGASQNVKFDITAWDTRDMAGLAFDGARALGISHTLIEVTRNSRNQQFVVNVKTANIELGEWTVTAPAVSWVKTDVTSDVEKYENGGTFKINIMEDLTGSVPEREAKYEIKSNTGGLKLTLVVRQTARSGVGITVTPNIITVGREGFPTFSGGTPTKEQKIQFTTSGVVDMANSTYGVTPMGDASGWCRVKNINGSEVGSTEQLKMQNYFVVEVDPLSGESTARLGYLQIRLLHDGVVEEFLVQVRQTATISIVQTNVSVVRIVNNYNNTALMPSFQLQCNIPVDIFWGGWTEADLLPPTSTYPLPPTTLSAGTSTVKVCLPSGVNYPFLRKAVFEVREKGLTDKVYATVLIYVSGCITSASDYGKGGVSDMQQYPLCYNRMLVGQYFIRTANSSYTIIGYYWGRSSIQTVGHNTADPTAWNKGSEAKPVKGDNDPCPAGWRMMTRSEYSFLIGRQAFSEDATYEDTKAGYLSQKLHPALSTTMQREWTSYYDAANGGTVCYFDWTTKALVDVKVSDLPADLTNDERTSAWGAVRCIME